MVSIIIPVLNEASTIETTLRSVSSLQGDHEVIVVDGGSSDATAAIAGSYARVLSCPKGRSRQMNTGARGARGDVLLFLHADTKLPRGAVAAIEESLADPAVMGGRFRLRLDQPGWPYRVIARGVNTRDRLFRGFTGDQAIFIRTGVFKELGGYSDMPLLEDLDLAGRMCRAGKVVRLPLYAVTSARRWQKNGLIRTVLLMWALRLLFVLRFPTHWLETFYMDTR